VVDLFSGAGGFSLGFHAAGCIIRAGVDVDGMAVKTFARNFTRLQPDCPPRVTVGDIERLPLGSLVGDERPDILIGGPPCQGFSRVGRAKLDSLSEHGFGEDPRNALYRKFLDAAERWHPLLVVMENVPGMLSVGGENVADAAARELAGLGYRVGYAVLNAVWYGVPQFRERLFVVGVRDDMGVFPLMPAATHRAVLPPGYLRPEERLSLPLPFVRHYELSVELDGAMLPATTVAEALDDLPVLMGHLAVGDRPARGDFRRSLPYRSAPHSDYARLMRAWPGLGVPDAVVDHVTRPTPRDYRIFREMAPGDRYPDALVIARRLLDEELARLQAAGHRPARESDAFLELVEAFVPPYPEDIFVDKWRKLVPDQPSWTIPAHLSKDSYSHIHHDAGQARMISIREAARFQSFPDAFVFAGNMGECFRQIGNAVPPLVARAIADVLLPLLGVQRRSSSRPRSILDGVPVDRL